MADQPSPRRRFQFRLRTLFVVVTLFAVASWIVADRARLVRERDEAVERSHNRAEAMAWMEREHRAQAEADSLRALMRANHIEPPPSPP
jgi:hypothetical protein